MGGAFITHGSIFKITQTKQQITTAMTIDIPLSTELLTWWLKNMKYNEENAELTAPLPIRLDFKGQSVDLAKAGINLRFGLADDKAFVDGNIAVSSNADGAQAKMFGLEFMRDHVSFNLTPEEKKMIYLMCMAADMVAWRAVKDKSSMDEYSQLFNNSNTNGNEQQNG